MANADQVIEKTVLKATKVLEEQLDSEIEKLERLNDDDIEKLRQKRIQQVNYKPFDRGVGYQAVGKNLE